MAENQNSGQYKEDFGVPLRLAVGTIGTLTMYSASKSLGDAGLSGDPLLNTVVGIGAIVIGGVMAAEGFYIINAADFIYRQFKRRKSQNYFP